MKKLTFPIKYLSLILGLGLVLFQSACSDDISLLPGDSKPQEAVSDLSREDQTDYSLRDLAPLVQGNTAFALDLYQELKSESGNLFYSPYSISTALAMTYAGAAGETASEMADVFHFPPDGEKLHPALNALSQHLEELAQVDLPQDQGDPFQLQIANALWGQENYHFEKAFLDTLARYYGAGLRLVDYVQEPEKSRQTINEWISDQTQEKIQDLIPQGAIDSDTRLVLSNAIYFKATWLEPFEQSLTKQGPFYGLDGSQSMVPLMSMGSDANLGYYAGEGFQAVDLPYVGGQVSMLVLMPDQGNFSSFEDSLSPDLLEQVLDGLTYQSVKLTFPKFDFDSQFDLRGSLSALGMPSAFDETADFSGMTGARDLFISDVFHKAFIAVDEQGTEAAAATAVIMSLTAAPANPIQLTVDRPFLFLIHDQATGTILFLGRVVQP